MFTARSLVRRAHAERVHAPPQPHRPLLPRLSSPSPFAACACTAAFLCALACAALVGVARAGAVLSMAHTAESDRAAVGMLLDWGCADAPPPCWAGITPGVTALDAAADRLRAHPWVARVYVRASTMRAGVQDTTVEWRWAATAPAFLRGVGEAGPYLRAENGVVRYLTVPTTLAYAEVLLVLGQPSSGVFNVRTSTRAAETHHAAFYADRRVSFSSSIHCPLPAHAFFAAPVTLVMRGAAEAARTPGAPYHLGDWLYRAPCGPAGG